MSDSWFVLCRVVDHYGDAGVCWRLARQLANEYGLDVTLFIDDLATLQRLLPPLDPALDCQCIDGVTVQRLTDTLPPPVSASSISSRWPAVIIDAFGGGLPPTWLAALEHDFPPCELSLQETSPPATHRRAEDSTSSTARRVLANERQSMGSFGNRYRPPHWIVLEYLSAEPWVETMHGRASPPPSIDIPRHFFFPGFTEKTGGLLREKNLLDERDAFQRSPSAQRTFLESLGVHTLLPPDALLISLFCYDTPALPLLLDAWAASPSPIVCLVPETVAPETVQRWRQLHGAKTGATHAAHGNLTLHAIPFLPQNEFDKLLWCCDLNFVRGEDSFVRAQWAAKPFIWQAYRQEEQAHLAKVEAFLALYLVNTSNDLRIALSDFIQAWNDREQADYTAKTWPFIIECFPELARFSHNWEHQLSVQTDLVQQLTFFSPLNREKLSL